MSALAAGVLLAMVVPLPLSQTHSYSLLQKLYEKPENTSNFCLGIANSSHECK